MVEKKLEKVQVEFGAPSETLFAQIQSPPDDTVFVTASPVVLDDDRTLQSFGGVSSPAFGALAVAEVSRWDLLAVDLTGPTPSLVVLPGTPAAFFQAFQDSVPEIPLGHYPIAAILITEVTPQPVIILGSDILDVREFYSATQKKAASISYDPLVPGDWLVAPDRVKAALDELADRLNTDVLPQTVSGVIGDNQEGVSLVAARADHVHSHGDLSSVLTSYHHRAGSIQYIATDPTDWTDAGMANPPAVRAALDSLAGSKEAVGTNFSPIVFSDWDTVPNNIKSALDELAHRVRQGEPPSILEGIKIEAGTPIVGARIAIVRGGWRATLSNAPDTFPASRLLATKQMLFSSAGDITIDGDVNANVIDEGAGLAVDTHYAVYLVGVTSTGDVAAAISRNRPPFGFTAPDLSNLLVNGNIPDVYRLIGAVKTKASPGAPAPATSDFYPVNVVGAYHHFLNNGDWPNPPSFPEPGTNWTQYDLSPWFPPTSTRAVCTLSTTNFNNTTGIHYSAKGGTTGSTGGHRISVVFGAGDGQSQSVCQFTEFMDDNQNIALRRQAGTIGRFTAMQMNGFFLDRAYL